MLCIACVMTSNDNSYILEKIVWFSFPNFKGCFNLKAGLSYSVAFLLTD